MKPQPSLTIPLLISIVAIVLFISTAQTMTVVWVFVPGMIVTFLVYLRTYRVKMPEPAAILPLYLVALAIQFLHFTEEYLTDFTTEMPALLNEPPYPVEFWLTFNMIAYAIFILGGISLFSKNKSYSIIPLFFLLIGVILNSVAHFLISIFTGGYFPGLFTAIIYLFLIPKIMKVIRIME